jgi:ABC-type transporter Mla subunit MlaD
VFGPGACGYRADVGGHAKRSLMQVEPARLVELAASSEHVLDAMRNDWSFALDELSAACSLLGDNAGTVNLAASYADALADAGEVVASLADALQMGIAGLVDAAQDAVRADDTVAAELARASRSLGEGPFGSTPGCGGR